jgi:hypothetical protein
MFDYVIRFLAVLTPGTQRGGRLLRSLYILGVLVMATSVAKATLIYQTHFETSEGYTTNLDLIGQNSWTGLGSGGNGIVAEFFTGRGQQAYVGFGPPNKGDKSLFVFPPLNKNLPQVQFSVRMAIFDSSNTNWDDFYWSVFNQNGNQLFTLDFENYERKIYYSLDGTNQLTWSNLMFTNGVEYPLSIDMDFTKNRWSAVFNGSVLTSNQPITTIGSSLNLGDIDAAWAVYDTNAPGNNFMVFDDYVVNATIEPPQLTLIGMLNHATILRLSGQPDMAFAIEASANLQNWLPIKTNITTGGSFDYIDSAARGSPRRFYRGRWVP